MMTFFSYLSSYLNGMLHCEASTLRVDIHESLPDVMYTTQK